MHINNDFNSDIKTHRNAPLQEVRENSAKEPETVKNGEILKGKVVDIGSDKVSVRLESGEMISARLPASNQGSGLGEVKIGDNINLRVAEKNGQQSLEIIISKGDARQNIIGMALNAAGLKLTEENARLIELLLTNQKPIDAGTIKKFHQALKLVGQENVNQALFILDNDMPVTKGTAERVEQYSNREQNIKHQIAALEQAVEEMESGPVKDRLIEILSGKPENQTVEKAAAQTTEQAAKQVYTEAEKNSTQKTTPPQQIITGAAEEAPPESTSKAAEQSTAQKQPLQALSESLSEPMKQSLKTSLSVIINLAEGTDAQKLTQIMQEFEKTDIGKQLMKNISSTDDFKELLKMAAANDKELSDKVDELIKRDTVNADKPERDDKKPALGLRIARDSTPKELEDFYNNILSKINNIKETLAQSESTSSHKILSTASDIEKNLEFFSSVKNEIYLQAPILINNVPTQSELFVFKDKKQGKKSGQTKSALIALDLLNLGHFETYIQKTGNRVNLQFRLERPDVEKLVKANINKLNHMLSEKGISISEVSYKTVEEPFTPVDSEPTLTDTADRDESNAKRISFDIRT